MAFSQPCPNCHYQRTASDDAPDWQCPACGVAYTKAMGVNQTLGKKNTTHKVHNGFGKRTPLDWVLTIFFFGSLISLTISYWATKQLPFVEEVVDEMLNEPIQSATRTRPFEFDYRGETYLVEPVADYELWGVVVTHNDITGMTDITHTEDSVDIKDICVVWGPNVQSNDYREVSYSSGDFTCFFSYKRAMQFYHNKLSNNHLLSDNEQVRQVIRDVNIGDQVHLKGMLVNYAWASRPNWKRNSSTTRNDAGRRACEVVFVDEFEILKATNSTSNTLFIISAWMLLLSIILKIGSIALVPYFRK